MPKLTQEQLDEQALAELEAGNVDEAITTRGGNPQGFYNRFGFWSSQKKFDEWCAKKGITDEDLMYMDE
jgi:hypothetical protein|tara:strand:+ start:359 stop:565 length:207 start_codon:yes stop_codon:yes gene_type:complete